MAKIDLRARISGIIILILLIIMPFAIWKGYNDTKKIKQRGKNILGTVVKINGFMGRRIIYEYEVNGQKFENYVKISSYRYKVGYKINLLYDSLDFENVMVVL
jgi:hypothetical protein